MVLIVYCCKPAESGLLQHTDLDQRRQFEEFTKEN